MRDFQGRDVRAFGLRSTAANWASFAVIGGIAAQGVSLLGVKTLDARTATQQSRIEKLEKENADLRSRLQKLEAAVSKLRSYRR